MSSNEQQIPRQNHSPYDGGPERGREADSPTEIPRPGWKDVLTRLKREMSNDNVAIVSAGVAFFALFALIPGMTALIALWGLVADPVALQQQVMSMAAALPPEAQQLLRDQVERLTAQSSGQLGWAFAIGLLVSLWSARAGMNAIVRALNIAYDEEHRDSFLRVLWITLLLTLGAIIFVGLSLAAIIVVPNIIDSLGLGAVGEMMVLVGRWVLLFGLLAFGLTLLYRYAPNRTRAEFRWLSPGSLAGTTIWIIASLLFSFYVSNFGSYNQVYGSLAGVVILLMWFYVTGFVVIMGAELNAELESQTLRDSTIGPNRPIGERGAVKADTVGRRRERVED